MAGIPLDLKRSIHECVYVYLSIYIYIIFIYIYLYWNNIYTLEKGFFYCQDFLALHVHRALARRSPQRPHLTNHCDPRMLICMFIFCVMYPSYPFLRKIEVENERYTSPRLGRFIVFHRVMFRWTSSTERRLGFPVWCKVVLYQHWKVIGIIICIYA